nr:MAG TPA: Putative golgin subfamily A member 2-like protein 5 [Caudoviricetes sp.]
MEYALHSLYILHLCSPLQIKKGTTHFCAFPLERAISLLDIGLFISPERYIHLCPYVYYTSYRLYFVTCVVAYILSYKPYRPFFYRVWQSDTTQTMLQTLENIGSLT